MAVLHRAETIAVCFDDADNRTVADRLFHRLDVPREPVGLDDQSFHSLSLPSCAYFTALSLFLSL